MADPTYTPDDVTKKLTELGLTHWTLENGWIRRKYNTDGWPQTLMAVNAIGYLCEAAYHHADLTVTYAKLWVKLMTHDSGGITDKDFELALKIEETVLYRPEKKSALAPGNPKKFVFDKV
jgi:4a-hydroxytetrahydrobiopterin dehydratase